MVLIFAKNKFLQIWSSYFFFGRVLSASGRATSERALTTKTQALANFPQRRRDFSRLDSTFFRSLRVHAGRSSSGRRRAREKKSSTGVFWFFLL